MGNTIRVWSAAATAGRTFDRTIAYRRPSILADDTHTREVENAVRKLSDMNFSRHLQVLITCCCLWIGLPQLSEAFYFPLPQAQIREAYLLGRSAELPKISNFLEPYTHHFPLLVAGWSVQSIEFRTPYEQVVRRSWEHSNGYDLEQAEKDYAAQPEKVVVSIIISSTTPYPAAPPRSSDGDSRAGATSDPWIGLHFLVSQEHPLEPKKVRDQALYAGRFGKGIKKEVMMEFDANQFAPQAVRVHVALPDGTDVDAEFDLNALK